MIAILAALWTMRLAVPDLDGEDAVMRAQRLLRALGWRGQFELQTLLKQNGENKHEPRWWVGLYTPEGTGFVTLDTHTGRALQIQFHREESAKRPMNQPPTPEGTRRELAALHVLGYDRNVRLDSDGGYQNGPLDAHFYMLAHGMRFFNINPTYAHWLSFSSRSGAIEYFLAAPPLPEVNAAQPRVPASTALARINAWADRKAAAKRLPPEVYRGGGRPELGYWKFNNEPTARLVWRVARYTMINGQRYGRGAYGSSSTR